MTAIAVGSATATVKRPVKAAAPKTAAPKKGWLARIWNAFLEGRMRQVERELAMHRHLLPQELQLAGERLSRSEKDLPFSR